MLFGCRRGNSNCMGAHPRGQCAPLASSLTLFLDSHCSRLNICVCCSAPQYTQRSLFAAESSRRSSQPRTMWNDEDNNPYGTSFERRDSSASSTGNTLPRKFHNLIASFTPDLQDDVLYLLG